MKKWYKIVSMLLVLSLFVCSSPFALAENTSAEVDSYAGFHAPTVRKMIDMNLESGNVDEGFFHLLANAYLADPELLIETILDLSQEDIVYLAKAIAYDLQRTQRQAQIAGVPEIIDPNANAIRRLIAVETGNPENASLNVFDDESLLNELMAGETQDAELLASVVLSNLQLNLSTNEAELGETSITANITFDRTPINAPTLTYRIRIYRRSGNETLQWADTTVTVQRNTGYAIVNVPLDPNAMGQFEVYAEVYSLTGTLLLTSASKQITIRGRWHIDVVLPVDRDYKGTLKLYNASGTVLLSVECLGRSGSNADPEIYKGNTPTGECEGWLVGPVDQSIHSSYGPYKFINLNPISGDMKDYYWRSEFMIHGGSPETDTSLDRHPLSPTDGCIRVSNADQLLLQNQITNLVDDEYHYTVGTVSITEQE